MIGIVLIVLIGPGPGNTVRGVLSRKISARITEEEFDRPGRSVDTPRGPGRS